MFRAYTFGDTNQFWKLIRVTNQDFKDRNSPLADFACVYLLLLTVTIVYNGRENTRVMKKKRLIVWMGTSWTSLNLKADKNDQTSSVRIESDEIEVKTVWMGTSWTVGSSTTGSSEIRTVLPGTGAPNCDEKETSTLWTDSENDI